MVRPTWRGNDEQEKLIAAVNKAINRADEVTRKAEESIWNAMKIARDGGVPDTHLSRRTGIPRSTLIRHLGPRDDASKNADTDNT